MTKTQQSLCDDLFKIGAIKFGAFKLKYHDKHPDAPLSPIYIDLRVLRRFPKAKKKAIDVYQELIKGLKFDLLADIPTAATPLAASLSDRIGVGMITPRQDAKAHGTGAKVDGMLKEDKGKTALLIDDLVTKADSKVEAAAVLKKAGVIVKDIVVLIDRNQGGEAELKKRGYKLHSAFTMQDMISYFLSSGKLNKQNFKKIQEGIKAFEEFALKQ